MPGDRRRARAERGPARGHRSLRRRRSGRSLRRRRAAGRTRAGADGRRAGAHLHGPGRAWQRARQAMPAGRRPSSAKRRPGRERRRGEARTTLPATATRLRGDGHPRGVRRYEGCLNLNHVMFHRVSSVPTVSGCHAARISARQRAVFPRRAELGPSNGPNWRHGVEANWGRAFRPIRVIALSRGNVTAETAFPQGKILGERPRNRGRSPLLRTERLRLGTDVDPTSAILTSW